CVPVDSLIAGVHQVRVTLPDFASEEFFRSCCKYRSAVSFRYVKRQDLSIDMNPSLRLSSISAK
ncbi:hypothetical protein ACOTBW_21775, partial [Achromobacter dolens]|uniref:hypothetical protein n=1 Tax=Achromobacter dolens TaxID=1287738 RepID=UPI003B9FDE99